MDRPLVIDISRAISRAHHATPSGVDRVDAAYRRWALAQADRAVFGLARMRRGVWLLAREGLSELDELLAGRAGRPSLDLAGLASLTKAADVRRAEALVARHAVGRASAPDAGRMAAALAPGARYLNTSHSAMLAHGLAPLAAAGLRVGALIHDALPLDRPEFFTPQTPREFEAKLRSALALADALIANSAATAARIRHWAGVWDLTAPEIVVAPLGVETRAGAAAAPDPAPPIFVILGTIEPRKNHFLLLHVWRRLLDRLGPEKCPHLHVVGRRGWENENIVDLLERSPAACVVTHERGALDEAELHALLSRATALLTPSFDEGFGLPVAEALAAGVPVIASDIPAHREVGGEAPDYLDPLDGPGWEAAVLEYAEPGSTRAEAARVRAARYAPPGWDAHFHAVEAFLAERDADAPATGSAA